VRRYRAMIEARFAADRAALRDFYAAETSWAEQPLWSRRRAPRYPHQQ